MNAAAASRYPAVVRGTPKRRPGGPGSDEPRPDGPKSRTRSKSVDADTGISESEVSRICADLDVEVAAFGDRSLAEQPFRYVLVEPPAARRR